MRADLPISGLPQLETGADHDLLLSPNHPKSALDGEHIRASEKVSLVATDEEAAWLLIEHDNALGWIPSLVSATNVGTLEAPLVIAPLSASCSKYLAASRDPVGTLKGGWRGPAIIYGSIFDGAVALPSDATLSLNVMGGGKVTGADYVRVSLTNSQSLILFVYALDGLAGASEISFSLRPNPGLGASFQAALFALTCPPDKTMTSAGVTLRIGQARARAADEVHSFAGSDAVEESDATASSGDRTPRSDETSQPTPVVIKVPSGLSKLPAWLEPGPTPTPVRPAFAADKSTLAKGECTYLRWEARTARKVYLNGENVLPKGARRICPGRTQIHVLSIKEPDGRRNDFRVTIDVR